MDGGAWWAAVHGVAKSRTRLSNFTFTFHFYALEEKMATHSSVLAWRIPGMGSHRVGHDWSDLAAAAATSLPTPVSNSTPTNKAKLHPCQWQPTTPSDHLTLFQKHFHFFHPQPDTSMSTQAIFYNPPRAMVLLLILALTRNTGLWFFLPQTTVRNPLPVLSLSLALCLLFGGMRWGHFNPKATLCQKTWSMLSGDSN